VKNLGKRRLVAIGSEGKTNKEGDRVALNWRIRILKNNARTNLNCGATNRKRCLLGEGKGEASNYAPGQTTGLFGKKPNKDGCKKAKDRGQRGKGVDIVKWSLTRRDEPGPTRLCQNDAKQIRAHRKIDRKSLKRKQRHSWKFLSKNKKARTILEKSALLGMRRDTPN